MQWQRNTATDLPECKAIISYTIRNEGTASDTAQYTLLVDDGVKTQSSCYLDSSSSYSDQYVITVSYDTPHAIGISASAWESSSSIKKDFIATFPRYMPLDYASMFITPNDPIVISKVAEIVTNPFWPDIWELRDWVVNNIDYPRDDADGDGYPDYDYVYHESWDYWQFPRETVSLRTGDCEDFSILLVSLLRADGYGSSDVYVIGGSKGDKGHAWVVVKVLGVWWTIEPQWYAIEGGITLLINTILGQPTELSGYKAEYKFNDLEFYTIG
jgi:hypothetical protein